MNTIEIWKPIQGYENYMVSSHGRVKSLNYNHTGKEKILQNILDNSGYYRVNLSKDGKWKPFLVHRLVGKTFIPNPDNKPFINHRDETRCNNCVENLEWCTPKYNVNYGTCKERISKANTNNPKLSTPIKCFDLETNEITYYPSIPEASRQLKILRESIRDSIYKNKKPYKKRYIFTEIKEARN